MLEKLGFQQLVEETLSIDRQTRVMPVYRFVLALVLALYVGFSRLNHLRFLQREPMLIFTAVDGGSGNFDASTSVALTEAVTTALSSTALSSSVNPSEFHQSVTFTAKVTSATTGIPGRLQSQHLGDTDPKNVEKAGSFTALSASVNPSAFNQSLTFTAKVTPATSGIPSGTVTFKNGATVLGTVTLNSSGIGTLVIASLSVGAHSITAPYSGNTKALRRR